MVVLSNLHVHCLNGRGRIDILMVILVFLQQRTWLLGMADWANLHGRFDVFATMDVAVGMADWANLRGRFDHVFEQRTWLLGMAVRPKLTIYIPPLWLEMSLNHDIKRILIKFKMA